MAIQLELNVENPTPVRSQEASAPLNQEELSAFISLLANANPPILSLPEGKTYSDIKWLTVSLSSNPLDPFARIYVSFK